MGSMFSGNRLNKEEMEVVVNKAKEIVSAHPVVVFRFEISRLSFFFFSFYICDAPLITCVLCLYLCQKLQSLRLL